MRRPFECEVVGILSYCCDGAAPAAATESLLRARAATELRSTSSVALILRVASLGRDAQNDETSIRFPPRCFKFQGSWPTVLGQPLAP